MLRCSGRVFRLAEARPWSETARQGAHAGAPYLVGGEKQEVIGRIRDDVAFEGGLQRGAAVPEPVQADAEDAVVTQRVREQLAV